LVGLGATGATVEERIARHEARGYPLRRLDREGIATLEPDLALVPDGAAGGATGGAAGGAAGGTATGEIVAAHFTDEAWIAVPTLVGRLLRVARGRHATVMVGDPVTELEVRAGRVAGVRLESGASVPGDLVVLAAGPATGALAERVGMRLPMAPTPGLLAVSGPVSAGVERVVHAGSVAMRPDGGGRIMLSSRAIDATLDPSAEASRVPDGPALDLLGRGAALLPELASAGLESARIGRRSVAADGLPVAGFAPGIDGLYLLVAHSGVTLAPILGRLVAAELLGRADGRLDAYRPARLSGRSTSSSSSSTHC
jgi:glycine/D-amino acid oxidase-like deaminating enzyme